MPPVVADRTDEAAPHPLHLDVDVRSGQLRVRAGPWASSFIGMMLAPVNAALRSRRSRVRQGASDGR